MTRGRGHFLDRRRGLVFPPASAFGASGGAVNQDEHGLGSDVQLLVNFDGTSGLQDSTDESQNSLPLTWDNNAVLSDLQTFNGSYGTSLLLDGVNDRVWIPDADGASVLNLGALADWTVEIRVRFSSVAGLRNLLTYGTGTPTVNGSEHTYLRWSGSFMQWSDARGALNLRLQPATSILANTWYDIAVTQLAGVGLFMHIDGVYTVTNPILTAINTPTPFNFLIGINDTLSSDFFGHIQAIRWTLGARYTEVNYTPLAGKWHV